MSTKVELTDDALRIIARKARKLVGRVGLTSSDIEDIQQEMAVVILRRLKLFDPKRSSYTTFVQMVVNWRATDILRHRRRKLRYSPGGIVPLDDLVNNGPETRPHDTIASNVHDRRLGRRSPSHEDVASQAHDVKSVLGTLTAEQRSVALMLMHMTPTEAARDLGMSKQRFSARYMRPLRHAFHGGGINLLEKS